MLGRFAVAKGDKEEQMPKFLVLHTIDPRMFATDPEMKVYKKSLEIMTPQAQCISSLVAPGAGKIACEWDAESQQAVIDCLAKAPELPVDGIYPAQMIVWAEVKKQLGM